MASKEGLERIASILRRDVLQMTSSAGSGHPTSCLSAADIMAVLFFDIMRYDPKKPSAPNNDEFILSKGHAAPLLYAALQRAGCMKEKLDNLRKSGSILEGHPTPALSWVKVATGSLGQGLGVGAGMALALKKQQRNNYVYVLLGDSECAEGSVWEAANFASFNKLDNLYAIIDMNSLGQTGKTMLADNVEELKARWNSCGWATAFIDGHDVGEIKEMLTMMRDVNKPIAVIARTIKGKGVSFLEGQEGWHGRALDKKELKAALAEIPLQKMPPFEISKPSNSHSLELVAKKLAPMQSYSENEEHSTRQAFGNALLRIAKADSSVIAIDGEVGNSTFTGMVKDALPAQFVQAYIAEQNMISLALGLSKKGFKVAASTFAAFLTRAHDQLRMAAISNGNFVVNGSHSGCSIGADGASQMGLEDIAMMRSIPSTAIFYPSDAVSAEKLTELAFAQQRGLTYIRTTREKLPVLYDKKAKFEVGKFSVLRQSPKDGIVLIGAGITTHEALKAAKMLKKDKIAAAVVDLYCITHLNATELSEFVSKHGNKMVIAEDHYKAGGIGEMLQSLLQGSSALISHLCVHDIPHSGTMEENLAAAGIDAKAIHSAAKRIIHHPL